MNMVEVSKGIQLNNILFATDFSQCANAALPYAIAMAQRYGSTLQAAYTLPDADRMVIMAPETWPLIAEEDTIRTELYIEQLEQQLQKLPHCILTPKGEVADALTQIIDKNQIDLLVLGTHGRAGVDKLLMGSVAEEIYRRATCPVLSVGPNASRKLNGEIQFQQILFATDFGRDSIAALAYAVSLAEEDDARLVLLHVVEQPEAGFADVEDVKLTLLNRLRELVPPEAEARCHAECRLEFGHQFARPSTRILEVAKTQAADLIVLGVRKAHRVPGLATHLTSTTAQILTLAECPVLTVRDGYAR